MEAINTTITIIQSINNINTITTNTKNIISNIKSAKSDIITFPELAITGYIPKDHLLDEDYINQVLDANNTIIQASNDKMVIFGSLLYKNNKLYNAIFVAHNKQLIKVIKKSALPNYELFNEFRYFTPSEDINPENNIITFNNQQILIALCEDLWNEEFLKRFYNYNIALILSINASHYTIHKEATRLNVIKAAITKLKAPLIYLNQVGAIDTTVFDGRSLVIDQKSSIIHRLSSFTPDAAVIQFNNANIQLIEPKQANTSNNSNEYNIYEALVLSVRNYVKNTKSNKVVIGISGGIDSALVAAICCDAIGAENTLCVSLPSQYTSQLSKNIIDKIINNLECKFYQCEIDSIASEMLKCLQTIDDVNNSTQQNLQARVRSSLLLNICNMYPGSLLVNTSNKSELAIGYSTFFGDSIGAFNPIKDLYKTQVYEISKWRNQNTTSLCCNNKLNIIPEECINRPPSAELQNDQEDEKDIGIQYTQLDEILYSIIEKNMPYQELEKLYNKEILKTIYSRFDCSEYKRYYSSMGTKVSERAFNHNEWHYNISNFYKKSKG